MSTIRIQWALLAMAAVAMHSPFPAAAETTSATQADLFGDGKTRLVIRVDDAGFCHAANTAVERILDRGCVSAVSVMVVTPWLDEAVEILKRHPETSVGVHVCLNSEWTPYRWGPVLPPERVPSLVDEWGKFFGTRKQLVNNRPNPDEAEKEMRAQVDLAIRKGLRVSYMDHHMGAAVTTPELKERFVRVARDYGLGISRWFGEKQGPVVYPVEPARKTDFLLEGLRGLNGPGLHILVCHPGLNVAEMSALRDLNPGAPLDMPAHRQAETEMLCDPRLRSLLRERGIELTGYAELRQKFLDRMTPPAE